MLRLKTSILILLFFCFYKNSFSQNFKSQVHGGINFSQVDGDKYAGYNQLGIYAGFSFFRVLKSNKNIGFEINYSSKGSRKKTSENDPSIFKLRINYVGIPVYAEFKKVIKGYDKLYIKAGLSGNILINSKTDFGFGWQKLPLNSFELSGIAGLRYLIDDKLSICVVHENSVLPIRKTNLSSQYYYANRRGLFNRLITISVCYKL